MIKVIQLLPGITLRCCPERRFKRGFLSLQLIRPMNREENALNALLPSVLLRGTSQYPDLRAITTHLDDLYGAGIGATVRRVGDYHTTGFGCSFIDDRFAMPGDQVLAPMLDFLCQLLTDPVLEQGLFRQDVVETEKKNLIAAIEATFNNKRQYAVVQLLRLMCKNDPAGIPRLGTPEQVAAITAQTLCDHYRKILRTSPMEIFYVGSAEPEQVADILRTRLAGLERQPMTLPSQSDFADGGKQTLTEEMEVNQGRMCLGFLTPITLRDPRFAAMKVCNAVLGGSMISKLFMIVREKMSLCYDIDSDYATTKGIVTVTAGVDCTKFELVRDQVLAQLDACKAGQITDVELSAAKERLISSLRRVHDSGGTIENYYAVGALTGLEQSPDQAIAQLERVTVADVAEAAKTLQLHTEYFLKGVQ